MPDAKDQSSDGPTPLPSTEPPAPPADAPPRTRAPKMGSELHTTPSAPEIEVGDSDLLGHDEDATLSAISPDSFADAAKRQQMRSCAVLQLCSFVVPEAILPIDASPDDRTMFVEERLARRLPSPLSKVRRVDVHLFEPGAVLVRVWCQID